MASLCTICRNIPYSKLPSEDEPGHPHQPSLQALADSARKCQLCSFIQDAVNELKKTLEDEKKNNPPRWSIQYSPSDEETGVATRLYLGPAIPTDSGMSKLNADTAISSPTGNK